VLPRLCPGCRVARIASPTRLCAPCARPWAQEGHGHATGLRRALAAPGEGDHCPRSDVRVVRRTGVQGGR